MRTTFDLADDVLLAVEERARRERRTVGEVLSDLVRSAMAKSPDRSTDGETFFGFEPIPSRGQSVTNEIVDLLRDREIV